MIPQISESWASAYLQVVTGFLIFSISLPALISQLNFKEDVRNIYNKYRVRWGFRTLVGLTLIVIVFIMWIFHPCPGGVLPDSLSLILSITITGLLIYMLHFSRTIYHHGWRELVQEVTRKALKKGHKYGINPPYSFSMFEYIHDLAYLGEFSKAGMEKKCILDAIEKLLTNAFQKKLSKLEYVIIYFSRLVNKKHLLSYDRKEYRSELGSECLCVIDKTLNNLQSKGNIENYQSALEILKKLRYWVGLKSDPKFQLLYRELEKVMSRGCVSSISLSYKTVAYDFISALSEAPEQLFYIGCEAIRLGNLESTIMCLSFLEAYAKRNDSINGVSILNLIGMAANLYPVSLSTIERLHTTIDLLRENKWCTKEVFDNSKAYHLEAQDYRTADLIGSFQNYLNGFN